MEKNEGMPSVKKLPRRRVTHSKTASKKRTMRLTTEKNEHAPAPKSNKERKQLSEDVWSMTNVALLLAITLLVIFNQVELGMAAGKLDGTTTRTGVKTNLAGGADIDSITSTAQSLATLFPINDIQSTQDAIDMLVPTGTPEYSDAFGGISFDDPVGSLSTLAEMYRPLKQKIETEDPETFQRFMNLASKPVGISCEYCCGLKTVGIDSKGNSACGCQHNPALLSITMGLMASTDYSDAEILAEVMKWKTLFFPQDMINLAMEAAGGNIPSGDLPKMVGGC